MNKRKDILFLAGLFLVLLILFVLGRPGRRAPSKGFGGVSLPSVASPQLTNLDSCPTAKCLTVYVAPWCGVCRKSTGVIAALANYLKERGVDTRVVVGNGTPDSVRDYAREFGPDALLDLDDQVPVSGGVPNFIVSDAAGAILDSFPGVPGIYQPPYTEDVLREFAGYLELP